MKLTKQFKDITKLNKVHLMILKMWGEINEKVEYVEYKFKNEREVKTILMVFN